MPMLERLGTLAMMGAAMLALLALVVSLIIERKKDHDCSLSCEQLKSVRLAGECYCANGTGWTKQNSRQDESN